MKIKLNDFFNKHKYKISTKEICHLPIYIEIICYFFYFLEEKMEKNLPKKEISNILDEVIEKYFFEEVKFKLKIIFEEVLNIELFDSFPICKKFFYKLTTEEYANLFIKDKEDKYEYFKEIIFEENLSCKEITKDSPVLSEIRNYFEDYTFKKKI